MIIIVTNSEGSHGIMHKWISDGCHGNGKSMRQKTHPCNYAKHVKLSLVIKNNNNLSFKDK